MGKYIQKPKSTRDVGVMDLSSLGVCTRAKTLALMRLQSSSNLNYLQLRSRLLKKSPLHILPASPSARTYKQNPTPPPYNPCSKHRYPIEPVLEVDRCCGRRIEGFKIVNSEREASLGENNIDLEAAIQSWTRESNQCSMISITTPGSSTNCMSLSVSNQNEDICVPSAREMEDFFVYAEQPLQHQFIEKYNFNIVNDLPLPGHYEWVRIAP